MGSCRGKKASLGAKNQITPNIERKDSSWAVLTRQRLLREAQTKSLVQAFIEQFQDLLVSENPTASQVKQVFDWLRKEGRCAVSFSEINMLNKCRRMSELSFSKFAPVKELTWNESKSVGGDLTKRFEELRTIRRSTKGRLHIFEGVREEEKALPQR